MADLVTALMQRIAQGAAFTSAPKRRRLLSAPVMTFVLVGLVATWYFTRFSDDPRTRTGLKVTVIDGDSFRSGNETYRLVDIDTPELRQTCKDAKGTTWSCGIAARDRLIVALDEMSAMEELTPDCIEAHKGLLYGADMVIFDGNLPIETMAALTEFAHLEGIPVCVDPTSATLAPGIIPFLDRIDLFMPNLTEAQVFCDCEARGGRESIATARRLVQLGVDTAVIALGADGVAWASSDESGWIPAFPLDEVVDTVGAGAALTAGVVFGLLNDVPLDEAVRIGASAAALTLQSQETVRSDLSLDLLYEQIMVF